MMLCSIMNWQANLTILAKCANIIDKVLKKPADLLGGCLPGFYDNKIYTQIWLLLKPQSDA